MVFKFLSVVKLIQQMSNDYQRINIAVKLPENIFREAIKLSRELAKVIRPILFWMALALFLTLLSILLNIQARTPMGF